MELSDEEVAGIMENEATYFDDVDTLIKWLENMKYPDGKEILRHLGLIKDEPDA